jgi:hypothetical protein
VVQELADENQGDDDKIGGVDLTPRSVVGAKVQKHLAVREK